MDAGKVEQAMRTLSSKILTSHGEAKKKVYPVNYIEEETEEVHAAEDEGYDEEQFLQQLVDQRTRTPTSSRTMRTRSWCRSCRRWRSASTLTWQQETACERKLATVASGLQAPREEKVAGAAGRRADARPFAEHWRSASQPLTAKSVDRKAIGEWSVRKRPVAARVEARRSATLPAPMEERTEPMEVIMEVPPHTMSLSEMMSRHGSYTAPSLIRKVQLPLTSRDQLEDLVDMHSCFETQHEACV